MTDRALTLTEAADRLGWSRRSLVRRLALHQIPTYGLGRLERITPANLELLRQKEERCRTDSSRQASAAPAGTSAAQIRPGLSNIQQAKRIGAQLRGGSRRFSSSTERVVAFPVAAPK